MNLSEQELRALCAYIRLYPKIMLGPMVKNNKQCWMFVGIDMYKLLKKFDDHIKTEYNEVSL